MKVVVPNTPDPVFYNAHGTVISIPVAELPKTFIVNGTKVNIQTADAYSVRYTLEE